MQDAPFIILVVEDNEEELILLREAIQRANRNIVVRFVAHGEEAIDYLGGTGHYSGHPSFPNPTSSSWT